MNNVPGGVGFAFDMIITRINLTAIKAPDNSKIAVDVKFNRKDLKITSSRINVDEFKSNGLDFTENPTVLKENLHKNPLECKVWYEGKNIGSCSFTWPESIINCLSGDCSKELTHCDQGEIKNESSKIIGKIEVFTRLQIKCNEVEKPEATKPKVDMCNAPDTAVIDPNDILFVVGEDKLSSQICNEVDVIPSSGSNSSGNCTRLDLSDFRRVNGKTLPNADILNSVNASCWKPKNQFQQILSCLVKEAKKSQSDSCPAKKNEKQKFPWEQQTDCLSENKYASCSSSESYNPCRCISDENVLEDMVCQSDEAFNKPEKRYCPLCQHNITWLPKHVACPRCGLRPVSYDTNKNYDYNITAEKILKDFNTKKFDSYPNASKQVLDSQCRCTCKDGKECAHCRIRKLCADIFPPNPRKDDECGKCKSTTSDMFTVCKASDRDCRPYLEKVFQELKGIYDIKASKKKKNIKAMKENDCECTISKNQVMPVSSNNKKQNLDDERKQFLAKNFSKHRACKGQGIFDYNKVHTYPGTKIGHKTCFSDVVGRRNVPRNMGWLWNAEATGPRAGWQPGAIRKPIKALMYHFLDKQSLNACDDINLCKRKKKGDEEEENYTQDATLHICKKKGVYYVTLKPLKDPETLKECSNPYENMKPIQFKITKTSLCCQMSDIKQCLKELGFSKCSCHKPISQCSCRSFLDKKKLEYQCSKECQKRKMGNVADTLVLSDTSDSEEEFEFGVTPPAGVTRSERWLKRNIKKVNSGTQYDENDLIVKDEYPRTLSKYIKLYNCATGKRFGSQFGPYGTKGYIPGADPIEGIYGPCGIIPENTGQLKPAKPMALSGPLAFLGPDGKFSMAQYLAIKAMNKPSAKELAERKKQKMALLKGANPPLLCKVDRRGKPIDTCSLYAPVPCDPRCLRDNRIC